MALCSGGMLVKIVQIIIGSLPLIISGNEPVLLCLIRTFTRSANLMAGFADGEVDSQKNSVVVEGLSHAIE